MRRRSRLVRLYQRCPLSWAYPRWERAARSVSLSVGGIVWEYCPCGCDRDVCYSNRWHVWITLIPWVPLHLTWLVRTRRRQGEPR